MVTRNSLAQYKAYQSSRAVTGSGTAAFAVTTRRAPVTTGSAVQPARLSDLAIAKLNSSGISIDIALAAGIFSVEDAQAEVHQEFSAVPALVFQYYDIAGNLIFFERDGELLQFVRIRYLADPPAKGFIKHKLPKYMQLRASGVHAYFPRVSGFDWRAIAADPNVNIVITEGELKSLSLCAMRQPAIGIGGVDSFLYRQELRK